MLRIRTRSVASLLQFFCLSSLLYVYSSADAQNRDNDISILLRQLSSKDRSVVNAAFNALEQVDNRTIAESVPVLIAAMRDKNEVVRQFAVWLLSKLGPAQATMVIAEVKKALKDENRFVRASAVHSLGQLRSFSPKETMQALISALADQDLYVRSTTATVLGSIGPPAEDAIDELLAAWQDPVWLVRVTVLRALGKIGRGAAASKVLEVLKMGLREENPALRMAAIDALGDLGIDAENAVEDLLALTKDSDRYVGSAAMFTLGRIAHAGVNEAKLALESQLQSPISATRSLAANVFWQRGVPVKNAVPVLLKLLSDDLAETRHGAARSLGGLRPPTSDVIDSLRIALKRDSDGSVRSAAASSLANFGTAAKSAILEIRESLTDSDSEVRRFAAIGIGQLRATDAETLQLITGLLKDKSEPVRQQALWTFVTLGQTPADAVPAIITLLQAPATEIRRGAAVALRNAGRFAKPAVPNLILLLKDSNEQVRLDVIGTFGSLGPTATDSVPSLSQIIINERERINIRTAAAESLPKIGPGARTALPSLQIAMRSENDQVRSASVRAFAQLGTPSEILPVFTRDLKSPDVFARLTALQGLSAMGTHAKDAVPHLIERLKDEDEQVRQYAAGVLGNLKILTKDAVSALNQTLQVAVNPNGNASEALAQIAVAAQDTGTTKLIPELQTALESISRFDQFKEQREIVRRAVEDLKRVASLAAEPSWKKPTTYIVVAIAYVALNVILALLAIPFSFVRNVIFHPKGSIALRAIGKFLFPELLFRFVGPLRMALFRNYLREFRHAPMLKRWDNRQYIS